MNTKSAGRVAPFLLSNLLAGSALLAAALAAQAAPPPGVDAIAARALKAFNVPGASVAIVKDDQVVLARGYGKRALNGPAVDADTLFAIASNSKLFTAVALGLLVEEKKIEWDAPVTRYLPAFQMYDTWVTRELTVRDLLVHRSGLGLGAGDLLWWPGSDLSRPEIAKRLRFIPPATSFRSAYAYDNVLYLVAGEVIEKVSGKTWEQFITERILAPAGIRNSDVHNAALATSTNAATPYAEVDGKLQAVTQVSPDNIDPAGGIVSSAHDMARWLRVLLARGQLPDSKQRLYSEATAHELETPVTPVPIGEYPLELAALKPQFQGYALGVNVRDYRGHRMILHTGGLPGFVSRVLQVPDLHLGVAVLTNGEEGGVFDAIAFSIVDHYLNAPRTDWVAAFVKRKQAAEAKNDTAVQKDAGKRNATSKPSLPLAAYAGHYTDAWYGEINIVLEGDHLVIRFAHTPDLTGDLEHWQHDSFVARWRDRSLRADAYVMFALDADGSVDHAKMRAVSPATDFSFDFQDLLLKPDQAEKAKTISP